MVQGEETPSEAESSGGDDEEDDEDEEEGELTSPPILCPMRVFSCLVTSSTDRRGSQLVHIDQDSPSPRPGC
jgi:hypothetical protein